MSRFKRGEVLTTILLSTVVIGVITTLVSSVYVNRNRVNREAVKAAPTCGDNPESAPAGYKWQAHCSEDNRCSTTNDCSGKHPGKVTWCYGFEGANKNSSDFRCLTLEKLNSDPNTDPNQPIPTIDPSQPGAPACQVQLPPVGAQPNCADFTFRKMKIDTHIWNISCNVTCPVGNNSESDRQACATALGKNINEVWCYKFADGPRCLTYGGDGGSCVAFPLNVSSPTTRPTAAPTVTKTPTGAPLPDNPLPIGGYTDEPTATAVRRRTSPTPTKTANNIGPTAAPGNSNVPPNLCSSAGDKQWEGKCYACARSGATPTEKSCTTAQISPTAARRASPTGARRTSPTAGARSEGVTLLTVKNSSSLAQKIVELKVCTGNDCVPYAAAKDQNIEPKTSETFDLSNYCDSVTNNESKKAFILVKANGSTSSNSLNKSIRCGRSADIEIQSSSSETVSSPTARASTTVPTPQITGGASTSVSKPDIRSRSEWNALPPNTSKNPQPIQPIKYIIIHHTGSPGTATIAQHQRHHMGKNASVDPDYDLYDLAYHYIVHTDGKIYEGRNPQFCGTTGTATGQYRSSFMCQSILVVLSGDFNRENIKPGDEMMNDTLSLVSWLAKQYNVPTANILAHKDVDVDDANHANTQCNGTNFYDDMGYIRSEVNKILVR